MHIPSIGTETQSVKLSRSMEGLDPYRQIQGASIKIMLGYYINERKKLM